MRLIWLSSTTSTRKPPIGSELGEDNELPSSKGELSGTVMLRQTLPSSESAPAFTVRRVSFVGLPKTPNSSVRTGRRVGNHIVVSALCSRWRARPRQDSPPGSGSGEGPWRGESPSCRMLSPVDGTRMLECFLTGPQRPGTGRFSTSASGWGARVHEDTRFTMPLRPPSPGRLITRRTLSSASSSLDRNSAREEGRRGFTDMWHPFARSSAMRATSPSCSGDIRTRVRVGSRIRASPGRTDDLGSKIPK
mmetsp:Transcript_1546/g.4206  ORF Transcript_1546/g.4206 Transcript_1546/m.4206 type:complete len:249 (-) Transcript_1546:480-1226(-)